MIRIRTMIKISLSDVDAELSDLSDVEWDIMPTKQVKPKTKCTYPKSSLEGSIPWIEKYRPSDINDIILDPIIEKQIKVFIEEQHGVHLIINGQPGVGKTTTVRCIAKKILGKDLESGYLELNAAEDRGIKSISANVPPFCKKLVGFEESKILLFDEAENLTVKCQYDIISMIKQFGSRTRFIFTCNDTTKIIEDLQSICRIIRFKPLSKEQITVYLKKICDCEGLTYDKGGIEILCYISNGDMRKAINNLQLTAYSFDKSVTKKHVLTICKMPDPKEIKAILELCFQNKLTEAVKEIEHIISKGYYYLDIVTSFTYVLTEYEDMEDDMMLSLIDAVNQSKVIISAGIRTKLQLTAMVCRIIQRYNNMKKKIS